MVRGRVDARNAVRALRQTISDLSSEHTTLRLVVQTLEERKRARVRRGRVLHAVHLLDHDVRVSLDVAGVVDLLGRGEVVLRCVHEVARDEVLDRHLDGEVRVRGDGGAALREHELGRGHVRERGDDAHWRRVAGASRDLQAVRDRQLRDGRAEVDEVVGGGERRYLAGLRNVLTVVRETGGDDGLHERE